MFPTMETIYHHPTSGVSISRKCRSALFGKKKKEYPGSKPKWVNLYGAPIGKGKGREAEIMNRYPSRGSAYRGRLLVSMRIENHPPAKLGNYARRRQGFVTSAIAPARLRLDNKNDTKSGGTSGTTSSVLQSGLDGLLPYSEVVLLLFCALQR